MNNFKLNSLQIETIIDRVVPIIAKEKDHEFFKGVLHCAAKNYDYAGFCSLIEKLLKFEIKRRV